MSNVRPKITRDGIRRLQAIDTTINGQTQTLINNIQYRGDHQLLRCDYGNGLTDQRNYDLQGRLQTQQLSNTNHQIIDQRHYHYDKNSNILNITGNHENNHYQYDKLDRITQDQFNTDNPNQLSYDLNDNRLSKNKQNQSQTENYRYQSSAEQYCTG